MAPSPADPMRIRDKASQPWPWTPRTRRRVFVGSAALATAIALANADEMRSRTIVAFGDSYFSGYGLDAADSFPVQFERALRSHGQRARVVNAGVPGETIADGLRRLGRVLAGKPDLIILELGANDAEQGLDPEISRANLDVMLARIRGAHVRVLLCGALAPTEQGEDYRASFDPIFPSLAAKHGVPLYPFILEGVASVAGLIQGDGEHPNRDGVRVMVDRILPVAEHALKDRPG